MKRSKPSIDKVFHALGDSTRRAILERLGRGPATVSALAEPLHVTITAISQHLQILEKSGLARTQKNGRVRSCQIETTGLRLLEDWIKARRPEWERRLDRLSDFLSDT